LEVNPNVLHRWRREFHQGPCNAFTGNGQRRWSEGHIAELERKIGQQALEIDFLKGCLQRIEAADAAGSDWKSAVYGQVQEEVKADRGLTIARMVDLGRVSGPVIASRTKTQLQILTWSYATRFRRSPPAWPSYGRPRITMQRRRGWVVNPRRVRRIMREDNLLCVRKRKFVVTTDSNHGRKIHPDLARKHDPDGTDQLWVSDITYIWLRVFLAVILGWVSRRVVGWALDRTLEYDLTLSAYAWP
jgi:hypothetical protein